VLNRIRQWNLSKIKKQNNVREISQTCWTASSNKFPRWNRSFSFTGYGKRVAGNECSAVTRPRIQNGGQRKRREKRPWERGFKTLSYLSWRDLGANVISRSPIVCNAITIHYRWLFVIQRCWSVYWTRHLQTLSNNFKVQMQYFPTTSSLLAVGVTKRPANQVQFRSRPYRYTCLHWPAEMIFFRSTSVLNLSWRLDTTEVFLKNWLELPSQIPYSPKQVGVRGRVYSLGQNDWLKLIPRAILTEFWSFKRSTRIEKVIANREYNITQMKIQISHIVYRCISSHSWTTIIKNNENNKMRIIKKNVKNLSTVHM